MFKSKHKLAPAYMDCHLVSQDTAHSYSTRLSQRGEFSLPRSKVQVPSLLVLYVLNDGKRYLPTFQILTSFSN